jgi:hypothetical protein
MNVLLNYKHNNQPNACFVGFGCRLLGRKKKKKKKKKKGLDISCPLKLSSYPKCFLRGIEVGPTCFDSII